MRGTVAKRFRKQAKLFNTDNNIYAEMIFTRHYRELGFDDAAISRKWYMRSKKQYKYWRRYPEYLGSFF